MKNFGGADFPITAERLDDLASLYMIQGKHSAAEPLFKRSMKIVEGSFNGNHKQIITALTGLGAVYVQKKMYAEAEKYLTRALKIVDANNQYEHKHYADIVIILSSIYIFQNKMHEAEKMFNRWFAILEKQGGHADSEIVGHVLRNACNATQASWARQRSGQSSKTYPIHLAKSKEISPVVLVPNVHVRNQAREAPGFPS